MVPMVLILIDKFHTVGNPLDPRTVRIIMCYCSIFPVNSFDMQNELQRSVQHSVLFDVKEL